MFFFEYRGVPLMGRVEICLIYLHYRPSSWNFAGSHLDANIQALPVSIGKKN